MLEDNAIRAVIIGVSVFIFIMTFTVIIIYYNTAIRSTDILTHQTNYGSVYEINLLQLMSDESTISGSEVKNIIRKTVENYNSVKITINTTEYSEPNLRDASGNILESIIYEVKYDKSYKIIGYNHNSIVDISFEEI